MSDGKIVKKNIKVIKINEDKKVKWRYKFNFQELKVSGLSSPTTTTLISPTLKLHKHKLVSFKISPMLCGVKDKETFQRQVYASSTKDFNPTHSISICVIHSHPQKQWWKVELIFHYPSFRIFTWHMSFEQIEK